MCVRLSGHAWGWGKPNSLIAIDYSFTVTSDGVDYPVTDHIETVDDENGAFRVQFNNKELPGHCGSAVSLSNGGATEPRTE